VHCKDISVKDVGFDLDPAVIHGSLIGWKAYRRSEYMVLRNREEHAIVRIISAPTEGLFKTVEEVEIVSLPDNTIYIEDEEIDVLNLPSLAQLQKENPGKAVVVQGRFSHIGFVMDLEVLELDVIDIVPPRPSKMRYLVDKALSSGLIDLPVIPHYIDADIEGYADGRDAVMFPCMASGISQERDLLFLDHSPDIGQEEVTLIGCGLSRRIFNEVYGRDPVFIDVCPRRFASKDRKTITKCCKVKEGFEISGKLATVPWGTTIRNVIDSINALFRGEYDPERL
jgi:hypothetical protein